MRRLPAAALRHAAAAAVLLGSLVALGAGTVGSPASVGAAAVGVVRSTSSAVTDLVAVGCGDASDCVAVGGSPTTIDVVPISSGVPGTPHPVAGVSRLAGVGCWSSTECLAIGTATNGDGVVVPISDGVPGAAQPVAGTQQLSAISCPGAGLCVVAGGHGSTQGNAGVVLSITDGVVSAPVIVHGVNSLSGIGCGAVDDCLAAGYADPYVVGDALIDIHGGVPGPAKQVVPGTASLSCSAPGDCVGIWSHEVIPISGGVAGVQEPVSPTELSAVSCLRDNACLAVGGESALPIENGVPMAAQPVDGGLHAVACLASGCVAVGSSSDHSTGVVVTLAAPPPPSQQAPPSLPVVDSTDITSFSWQSSPGQDMGHGTSGSFTPAEATFAVGSAGGVEPRPTLAGIGVQVSSPGDWWWVRVVPPQGQQLKAGVTYTATGQPFLTPGSAGAGQGPGLGVAENGFNCSTVGTFTLGNLRIAADGVIQQFTLSLTQSCAVVVSTPPQLIATIDFNIPRPPGSVPVATPAPATSGSSHGASPSPSVLPGLAGSPAPTAASGTSSASPSPTAAATGQPSPSSGALTALKRGALGLPATVNHRSGGSSATAGVLAGLALLVAVIVAGVARTTAKVARR